MGQTPGPWKWDMRLSRQVKVKATRQEAKLIGLALTRPDVRAFAWLVVEKMRADGWGVDLFAGFCGDNGWQCELGHPSDKSRDVMAEAATMPKAVCLAALKTIPGAFQ